MKEFCPYCQNDPVTHMQQKEICGTCEMETKVAKRKITNSDRIRSMSDEELAVFIDHVSGCPPRREDCIEIEDCEACWLDWLKQEAKDD